MKINSPKILPKLEIIESIKVVMDDGFVSHGYFENTVIDEEGIREFDGCRFKNVQFFLAKDHRISFVDCHFDHCEIANLTLANISILRCEFIECKCTGLEIIESYIRSALRHINAIIDLAYPGDVTHRHQNFFFIFL